MADAAPPILPPSFYEQRSHLAQIRAAALARAVSPDAVLHAILARLSAFSPSDLLLPPLVGRASPLNYFVAVVAPSGGGKSTAAGAATELLPPPEHLWNRDNVPVGTGEGLIESFLERDPDTGEKVQVHSNLFLYVDEGEVLHKLGQRDGTTLDTTIRSAFSGSQLGQRNAQRATSRSLPVNGYSLGMVVGFQPEKAGALLAQVAGGTPQRFGWAYAGLAGYAEEEVGQEWPGRMVVKGYDERTGIIQFPEDIRREILHEHYLVSSGQKKRGELDAHEPLHVMRIASLLALMEGRVNVTPADWTMARQVWNVERRVRRWVQLEVRAAKDDEEKERLTKAHHTAIAQAAGRSSLGKVESYTRARVLQELDKAGEDGLARSHIRRQLSPKQSVFLDQAIGDLHNAGMIEVVPGTQRVRRAADIIVVDD